MRQSARGLWKGMLIGLAVGVGCCVTCRCMMENNRDFRRRASRMNRDTHELINNLREIFG